MNNTITDAVFGAMSFNYGWCKEEEIEFFGKKMPVEILAEADMGQPISDLQRRSYTQFCTDIEALSQEALEQLTDYYIENLPAIGLQVDDPTQIPEEEALTLVDLIRMVVPKTVFFRQDGVYALLCDCYWEPQYGLAIILDDGDLFVGTQDEVL